MTIYGVDCDRYSGCLYNMKSISIIVPEHAVLSSISDSLRFFRFANEWMTERGKETLFEVELVGFTKEIRVDEGLFSVNVSKTLPEVKYTELIIVPAITGDVLQHALGLYE